ncbi:MAG TPA: phosphoribosylanthranilate isomerase [Candidatus Krumholzibacteria bacterium]|nr:phosphoribosylanthranilate isomerase [Candidatus Krumholzibacteria bacterium]
MTRTRIKICGITNASDAVLAASLGADYIGVIFADSPRRVDVLRAKEIRDAVPGVSVVGVFRNQPLEEVVDITRASGIDLIQLHGDEAPEFCNEVQKQTTKPVIKGFSADRIPDEDELAEYTTTSYFLFDLQRGSPTTREDVERVWTAASNSRRKGFRVFLAGALNPANVGEAIQRTHAFAVDVCRGVERQPGVKDPDVLQRFFTEARS